MKNRVTFVARGYQKDRNRILRHRQQDYENKKANVRKNVYEI